MRRLLLLTLLTPGLTTRIASQEPDQPWMVWREATAIRASADAESDRFGSLTRGDEISGEVVVNPSTDEEWLCFPASGELHCVTMNDLIRVHPGNRTDGDLPIGSEIANRWWGVPPSYVPSDLEPLPRRWRGDEEREYPLRHEAMVALVDMLAAARRDGIEIRVISGYRSFEQQERNFRSAIRRLGPGQREVARPGHSEHQLGTTVDLDDTTGEHSLTTAFGRTPEGLWLSTNGGRWGWRQSYTEQNSPETGYDPEAWHYRYYGRPASDEAAAPEGSPEVTR